MQDVFFNLLPHPLRNSCVALLTALLVACGGGSSSGSRSVPPPDPAPPPPPAETPAGRLRPVASDAELEENLKSALLAGYLGLGAQPAPQAPEDDGLDATPATDFSTTNLQEAGVDEADVVKYDGEILYLYRPAEYGPRPVDDAGNALAPGDPATPGEPARVRLLRTSEDDLGVTEVGTILLDEQLGAVDGMYLLQGETPRLVIAGHHAGNIAWLDFETASAWSGGRSRVEIHDTSDPASPTREWVLEWDGWALGSRRIGDRLYVLSRFSPAVAGWTPYPQREEDAEANRELVENTPLAELLPTLSVNGTERPLLQASDCLLPNPDYDGDGDGEFIPAPDATLTTVTVIDLRHPADPRSVCFNGSSSGFYMGRESLYITAWVNPGDTVLHKFALAEHTAEYRGSGRVPGFPGTGNPAFLMSEAQGVLRVFTQLPRTRAGDEEPLEGEDRGIHRLTLMREAVDAPELETVSQLPNAQRPEPIGKPEEQVYAVRYLGDRAYVVTFQLIDPLYVIDLADIGDPRIAGELEIPGFSSLLQPLGNDLLLGVGSEVDPNGPAVPGGVKLSLFDVADIGTPRTLGEIIIGRRGSYSAAQSSHHALTVLDTGDGHRVALPVVRHDSGEPGADNPWFYWEWTDSALYLFDIDSAGGLQQRGRVVAEEATTGQPWPLGDSWHDRGVVHGDHVYFVHDGRVWSSDWNNPDALLGPQ